MQANIYIVRVTEFAFHMIGDPHPGNVLVRKHPHKKNQFQVVLIDHGLYIEESEK